MIDLSWKVKKNTGQAARRKKADNAEAIGDSTGLGTRSSDDQGSAPNLSWL